MFLIAVFLCAWAAVKIPMILLEVKFLGADFVGLRPAVPSRASFSSAIISILF